MGRTECSLFIKTQKLYENVWTPFQATTYFLKHEHLYIYYISILLKLWTFLVLWSICWNIQKIYNYFDNLFIQYANYYIRLPRVVSLSANKWCHYFVQVQEFNGELVLGLAIFLREAQGLARRHCSHEALLPQPEGPDLRLEVLHDLPLPMPEVRLRRALWPSPSHIKFWS